LAAEMMGNDCRIQIIDSRHVTLSLGVLVLQAAKAAQNGESAEMITAKLAKWKEDISIFFTLKSLEYLQRTGRIGQASVLMGSLLNIKPILSIEDGVIVPLEKMRGNFPKVAEVLVKYAAQRYGSQPLSVGIIHTESEEDLEILEILAKNNLNIKEMVTNLAGPVVGTHVGPNAIGVVALPI